MNDLNDYLRRNPEVRRRTWLLVSEGRLLNLWILILRCSECRPLHPLHHGKSSNIRKIPADYIGVFWSAESKWGESGYLPYVSLHQEDNIMIKGLAYFSGGVMVGSTIPIEIGAYMSMKGINPGDTPIFFMLMNSVRWCSRSTTGSRGVKVHFKRANPTSPITFFRGGSRWAFT